MSRKKREVKIPPVTWPPATLTREAPHPTSVNNPRAKRMWFRRLGVGVRDWWARRKAGARGALIVLLTIGKHDYMCTNEPTTHLGSENYYWHTHECMYCDKTKSVMNGECERWLILHESN